MKTKQLPIPDLEDVTEDSTISDGYILDFISGEKSLKDTPKEQVRYLDCTSAVSRVWHLGCRYGG